MKKQKKGISLIVLVITIIVMLILASAIIITLSNSNIMTKAREAVLKTDVKNFEQELSLTLADEKLANKDLDMTSVNATSLEEIQKYIPSFDEKYLGKVYIQNGEIVYDETKVTEEEKEALESIGIKSGKIYTPAEIKAIIESKNLGIDVHTTDITPYVEGLSKTDAEKYTIYQGDLYYRYEKTTFEERLELYENEVLFLAGDANENGTLDTEDEDLIDALGFVYEYSTDNTAYACDLDGSLNTDNSDSYIVGYLVLYNDFKLKDEIDIAWQEPHRVRIIGDYWKAIALSNGIDETVTAVGYTELVKYVPEIKDNHFAERVSLIEGCLYIRLDKLTDIEKDLWLNELKDDFSTRSSTLIGDGNGDGYVTETDSDLIESIVGGATATDVQQFVLDINNDGEITIEDKTRLDEYLNGTITYDDLF